MGNSLTCVRRDRECCDVNTSLFGEDAFYREAFEDCREGGPMHDGLFEAARHQATLKWRKTRVAANVASFQIKKTAVKAASSCQSRTALKSDTSPLRRPSLGNSPFPPSQVQGFEWLHTMPEWTGSEFPGVGDGPYWQKGNAASLLVRDGPDYKQRRLKTRSSQAMYQALCCDAIKSNKKIENVIGRLVPEEALPRMQYRMDIPDHGGGRTPEWKPSCPLPRLICINMMLPFATGTNPFGQDHGCSVVGFFEIKPETLQALQSNKVPACVRLFKEFYDGPAGLPGGSKDHPDRSLHRRLQPGIKKDLCPGLLKAVAYCENPQDINIPEAFRTYNGKPCLITKSGYIIKDPRGEWLEIGVDVRRFNMLARTCLCNFRGMLPRASIHYGFWIQAVEDEDMPEAILCDIYCHGFNMIDDPLPIAEE